MELKKDFRNEMLKRREVEFVVVSEKNPGTAVAKEKAVEKFKVNSDNVVVKFVKNNYGSNEFLVEAFVYDSPEDLKRIEPKVKPKKSGGNA